MLATANKMKSIKIDLKGIQQASNQVRTLTRDLERLAAAQSRAGGSRTRMPNVAPTPGTPQPPRTSFTPPRPVPDSTIQSINRLAAAVRQYSTALSSLPAGGIRLPSVPRQPSANAGGGGGFSRGSGRVPNMGGGGVPPIQLPSGAGYGRQIAAGLRAAFNPLNAGQTIGRGFLAAVGGNLQGMVRDAARSGGRGIITADDANALAAGSGVQNVQQFAAIASQSSGRFKGTSAGEIQAAATEQVASLSNQLAKGAITASEYADQVQKVTDRIARNAQIFATMGQTQEQAAESARQMEKSLVILGTGTGQSKKSVDEFNNAILQAQIGVGGDIGGNEIKRLLQQLGSGVNNFLSPTGVQNAIIARDEGGARSTAEIRQFIQGLTRINKTEKALTAQREAGIRTADDTTAFTAAELADPVATVLDQMIPRLEKLGVNLDDATQVNAALQRSLGLTTSEANFPTAQVVNRDALRAERERIQRVSPQTLAEQQTLRVELADVEAQFQNVAASFTKAMLPAVKGSLDLVSSGLESVSKDGPTPTNVAALSAGAIGVGLTSGIKAMLDPATAPLGAAGLSLTASAAALSGSAAALTASAAAGGIAGAAGDAAKGGGIVKRLLGLLAVAGVATAGAKAAITPEADLARENRIGPGGVDDLIRWLAGATKTAEQKLQEGGEMRGDRENVAEVAAAAAVQAALKMDMGAARVANADAMAAATPSKPIPVTVTDTGMPGAATPAASPLTSPEATIAGVQPIVEAPNRMGEVFMTGMDRFAMTFGTGEQQLQQGLIAGGVQAAASLTGAGPTVGAAIAAQMTAVGPAIGAAIASAIRSATSSINVNVAGAGNTLPATAPANTGALQPIE